MAVLDKIAATRGYTPFIRCDNGPELTAAALRDWCRFTGAGTSYIEPGSPVAEPVGGARRRPHARRMVAIEQFDTLLEAQVLVADSR